MAIKPIIVDWSGIMLPKTGRELPNGAVSDHVSMNSYALAVAQALRTELGGTHKAIKTAMRWTGASERTVRNWFGGSVGPSGEHLIALIQNSDAVFQVILNLAARKEGLVAKKLVEARNALAEALDVLVGLTV